MSGWFGLTQSGLAPNLKHQAFLGAPKIPVWGATILKAAGNELQRFRFESPVRACNPKCLRVLRGPLNMISRIIS